LIDRERRSGSPSLTVSSSMSNNNNNNNLAGNEHRDREVHWLMSIANRLGIAVDTLSLAVAIFDRVLVVSRVQNKYVNCMALSSLSLACKLCEDADQNLVSRLRHLAYSPQELRRMELAILHRLDWDLALPSLFCFLQAMLSLCGPLADGVEAKTVRQAVQQVLCCSTLTGRFRSSLLALALLSLLLEDNKSWLSVVFGLQLMFQVENTELIECREEMHTQLHMHEKENNRPSELDNNDNNNNNKTKTKKKMKMVSEGQMEWSDALLVLYKVAQPD